MLRRLQLSSPICSNSSSPIVIGNEEVSATPPPSEAVLAALECIQQTQQTIQSNVILISTLLKKATKIQTHVQVRGHKEDEEILDYSDLIKKIEKCKTEWQNSIQTHVNDLRVLAPTPTPPINCFRNKHKVQFAKNNLEQDTKALQFEYLYAQCEWDYQLLKYQLLGIEDCFALNDVVNKRTTQFFRSLTILINACEKNSPGLSDKLEAIQEKLSELKPILKP